MVSFGSVLSGMIAVILLSVYGFYCISHIKHPVYQDLRFLIVMLLVAGFRMLIPINLPVNIAIPDSGLINSISYHLYVEFYHTGLLVYQVVILISIAVSGIILICKAWNYIHFCNHVKALACEDESLTRQLNSLKREHNESAAKVLYTDARISPFVFGVFHPVIVIPAHIYTDEEIKQVLRHELTHIQQHDLYIKAAFNVLTAIFWWNPFIWLIRKKSDEAIEISNDLSLFKEMTEEERTDYASLIVKTTALQLDRERTYSLSLATHGDPLIKRRVETLLSNSSDTHSFTALHVMVLILILAVSFIVTPEPYGIPDDELEGSFDLEEDAGSTESNTYIVEAGDHYDLYVDGEMIAKMENIPDEFKDYPVYTEKPDDGAE